MSPFVIDPDKSLYETQLEPPGTRWLVGWRAAGTVSEG